MDPDTVCAQPLAQPSQFREPPAILHDRRKSDKRLMQRIKIPAPLFGGRFLEHEKHAQGLLFLLVACVASCAVRSSQNCSSACSNA